MNGPIGLRKGVATINQTPGVTAHKIGELSLWFAMLAATLVSPMSHHLLFLYYLGGESSGCSTSSILSPPHILLFLPPLSRLGPGYELLPESVTGVIESALSSLSAEH